MALLQNGYTPPGDPFASGGVFSLASAERNAELAASAAFANVSVEKVTGTMRSENPDEYWTINTSVAGPVAELVASSSSDQIDAVRATFDPSLAPYERDGGLELPRVSVVTTVA